MFFNNDFLILSIHGGLEWTLSNAAAPCYYQILKASGSDRMFTTVVSKCYVGSLKANEFEFCHKRCKISCLWWKMRFSYTQSFSKPEFSEINKKYGIWTRWMWERAVHSITASAFRKLLSVYVFSYFFFGLEGRMWDLIVSIPDHCLSFYF